MECKKTETKQKKEQVKKAVDKNILAEWIELKKQEAEIKAKLDAKKESVVAHLESLGGKTEFDGKSFYITEYKKWEFSGPTQAFERNLKEIEKNLKDKQEVEIKSGVAKLLDINKSPVMRDKKEKKEKIEK